MKAKTAVLYARVSSKEQEEGYSIDSQLKTLRQYAASNNLAIKREFIEAETAKRSGRKDFDRMISLVQSQGIGAIVVEKTDRIYRNLKDRVTVDELEVELHLVKEGEILSKDSKSHAKFIHDIKLVVAKNYIDNLSEETRKGMLEKARQGIYPTHGPLGYLNTEAGGRRIITVDPIRGPLMKRLFEVYAAGHTSIKQLTDLAFDLGLRTKKGRKVLKSGLALMLQNPVYCGLIRWAGETHVGSHSPLVTKEVFDQVQKTMHGRRQNNAGYGVKEFAYKGLFTCGYCGCALTAELKKGKYVYYHCTGNRGDCPRPFVREEVLTEQFSRLLDGLSIPQPVLEWLSIELRENSANEEAFRRKQLSALGQEERRLKARLEAMYLDKVEGEIPVEVYRSLKAKTEEELANIRLAASEAEHAGASNMITAATLLELASTASFRFKTASNADKRELLSHVCSNCVYSDINVEVSLKKPFDIILSLNGQKAKNEDWLPAKDSNLDQQGQNLPSCH